MEILGEIPYKKLWNKQSEAIPKKSSEKLIQKEYDIIVNYIQRKNSEILVGTPENNYGISLQKSPKKLSLVFLEKHLEEFLESLLLELLLGKWQKNVKRIFQEEFLRKLSKEILKELPKTLVLKELQLDSRFYFEIPAGSPRGASRGIPK